MSHTTVTLQRNTQPVRLARPIRTVTLARVAGGPKGDPGTDTSLLVSKGDLLTHDGIDAVRLGVGTDGQLLSAASGEVEGVDWIDPPAADPLTSAGDLLTHDGIVSDRFALGTGGQYLRVNPGATAIEWDTFDIISDLPAHGSTHENGGSDEIFVGGLSGLLADEQTPLDHAANHLPSGSDPITTATAVTIDADTPNAEGTDESLARSDHTHDITTAVVVDIGAANDEGVSADLARADHVHDHINLGRAIPRSAELGADFTTGVTLPTYATLFTLPITTLLASSYLAFNFTCTARHTGGFTGNVAITVRFRLNGTLLPGGTTVNMVRNLIMPLARQGRVLVSAGVQTLVVEITKIGGGANVTVIFPVLLPDLEHAALRLAEEF